MSAVFLGYLEVKHLCVAPTRLLWQRSLRKVEQISSDDQSRIVTFFWRQNNHCRVIRRLFSAIWDGLKYGWSVDTDDPVQKVSTLTITSGGDLLSMVGFLVPDQPLLCNISLLSYLGCEIWQRSSSWAACIDLSRIGRIKTTNFFGARLSGNSRAWNKLGC